MPRQRSHEPVAIVCPTCQRTFTRLPPQMRRSRGKFCSNYCKNGGDPAMRLWSRVAKTADCWLWTGATTPDGYGRLTLNRTRIMAHRLAWELTYGPIPTRMLVCHHCDNPPCVNPAHLFLGTDRDNNQDMVQKGRKAILLGEQHNMAKLTVEDIQEIRKFAPFVHQKILAARFGVTTANIRRIVTRLTWQHIP